MLLQTVPRRIRVIAAGILGALVFLGWFALTQLRGDEDFVLEVQAGIAGGAFVTNAVGEPGDAAELLLLARNPSASIPATLRIEGLGLGGLGEGSGPAADILAGGGESVTLAPGEIRAWTGSAVIPAKFGSGDVITLSVVGENRSRRQTALAEITFGTRGTGTSGTNPADRKIPTRIEPTVGWAGEETLVRTDGGRPRRDEIPGDEISIRGDEGKEAARVELGVSPYGEVAFAFPGTLAPGTYSVTWLGAGEPGKILGSFVLRPEGDVSLRVSALTPSEVTRGAGRMIVVQGRGLAGTLGVHIGETALATDDLQILSDRVIAIGIPGNLPAGDYPVSVTTPAGTSAGGPSLRVR